MLLTTLAAAGCGSGTTATTTPSSANTTLKLKPGENPAGQVLSGPTKKRGGTLTAYSSSDFEHFDPGQAYYEGDYTVIYATQRPLFSYEPNTAQTLSPDLAAQMPTVANGGITDGGRTVTVHIRRGVHFSPPVNREVTSADVAYALERGANPHVANPYFATYFGAGSPAPLTGAQSPSYQGGPIRGIQTPNRYTIVFHMTKPGATLLIGALSLPLSAPVPESFAAPLDRHTPTLYGAKYLVATGPYMLKSDLKTGAFLGIGYQPGKSATLVRNPNWNPKTDFRPAYLNRININIGGDATIIGEQVLKGSDAVQLDTPAQSIVKLAYQRYPSQITFTPGAGDHYVALDNHTGPFKNVNVRRALWAALDRRAIVKARGGALVAQPATHFIFPGVNGYAQSGGAAGPQTDFNRDVDGNLAVARKYMRLAGYRNGLGSGTVQVVGGSDGSSPAMTEIVASAISSLGFRPHVTLTDESTVYAKYCGVPAQQIDACPSVGWFRDFADPLTVLYPTFYGPSIVPTDNANFGQVNEPAINAAMRHASLVVDPAARARAWAKVDQLLVDNAVAIPEDFDNQANIESHNVAGVDQLWDSGSWDLAFTSLR